MRRYSLHVKGTPAEAIIAAAQRGIWARPEKYHDGRTTLVTDLPRSNPLNDWIAEDAKLIDGQGYPAGTLLVFSAFDAAELPPVTEVSYNET